jgi:3-oxoacyl-[acyl-carrier protein] reductase
MTGLPAASVVITGSRQGIGRALSEHYLGRGCEVYGISRKPSDLNHAKYRHFEADVGDGARVRAVLQEIDAASPQGLRLVVNNAGIALSRLAIMTDGEAARAVLDTNVLGAFNVMREATKIMMRRGFGRVVNISSIEAVLASQGAAIYAASKTALEKLTEAFAWEAAKADLTFNVIGVSLFAATGMASGLDQRALDAKARQLSKPEMMKVEELAHAIDFLASPLSSKITNQTLYFGGVH